MDRYTDKTFSQLESHISRMYKEVQKDLRKKLEDFTRHHKAKDAEMQRKLKAGEITQAQYQQWITGQVFVGNQWKQKIEQVNNSIKGVMQNASHLTHGKSMDVFAENANYTAYQLEKDLGANVNFGLYDTSTVSRLVGKDPEILPRRVVNGKKLEAWETKKISNAISQGIIQGEGIDQIANRIARDTCIAADHSSVMYARTAMTAAQNSGRIERLHEAEEMGIRVQKRWMATLDDRTRDSHRDMDGETVDMDEKFSNGLMYPGDPAANDFAEICNCRCTMVYVYPEFTQSFERSASLGYDEEGHHQYETVKDMTYREWQKSKQLVEPIVAHSPVHTIVEGKDQFGVWQRRSDQFDFEIEDVIDAQGFDGLPRVVSAEEFDTAVQESGFIAQRTYSAPDQETLNAYRNQLYSGKWYVDCSEGGSAYGKGMYAVYNNGTTITEYMTREINGYRARRGVDYNYIETFTLAPNAKTITPDEITNLRNERQKKLMKEFEERGGWKSKEAIKWASSHDISGLDDGAVAAMFGYDAILTHGIDDYAIILNRTKVIFRSGK